MQKHLSRRELTRRVEQGRGAMRLLAAAAIEAGGTLRIKRDSYENIPPGHKMQCLRDEHTGDLVVQADMPALPPAGETLTFEELRRRYAKAPEARNTSGGDAAGSPRGPDGTASDPVGGGDPSPEPPD
jgi:hypothetical protein